jgi:hypothetical protein
MADCSPAVSQQTSEVNALNSKLAYDASAQIQNQTLLDNQSDARAWNELKLSEARDAQVIKYMAATSALTSDQTGQTENEQTVSPVRTGTGDAIVGTVGVSADAIAASMGNLATSLVPVIASALATAITQTVAALVPVVVTAAGGASTPSQTSPKPTTGA